MAKRNCRSARRTGEPAEPSGAATARWRMLLVISLPALCLLPFVSKAYNIDDPLFVWGARQIVAHPLDFDAGAGFYNDQWGPLAYFIGPTPKEAVVAALFDPSAR